MTTMTIRVTNATFESSSTGEFETIDDAYRAAVAAGIEIASGEVLAGSESSIVQIDVASAGQGEAARGAVAVSTARLVNRETT